MRLLILSGIFVMSSLVAFGQEMNKEQQQIVSGFIACVKDQDKTELASKIHYPLKRENPLPPIQNKQEFLLRYDEIFDETLTKMIVDSQPDKDWSAMGWRGIMLLNGDVWLDYDGKLIAINYQSECEKRKKDALIRTSKNELHSSLKNFKRPVCILKTAQYQIRIDDMGNGNYRYASWKLGEKMSNKPEIILLKGKYIADGSGGNHSIVFTNGKYRYECLRTVIGEKDTPPASLVIYKGGKKIWQQDAMIVNE
ncbi:MAG: hypothetical protein QM654_14180 [Dysgonamonadaceae bacterium]